jgi:inorganic pyrophosphatase
MAHVYAVVETPRGSRAKLEFDPKLGAFTLAKAAVRGADISLRLGL